MGEWTARGFSQLDEGSGIVTVFASAVLVGGGGGVAFRMPFLVCTSLLAVRNEGTRGFFAVTAFSLISYRGGFLVTVLGFGALTGRALGRCSFAIF